MASQSPRRRDLMRQNGYSFRTVVSDAEEVTGTATDIRDVVLINAWAKCNDVTSKLGQADLSDPEIVVLAADTMVVMDARVYGKPRDLSEAARFMRELGGHPHQVLTGVALFHPATTQKHDFVSTTTVVLRTMTDDEISDLFQRVDPLDKAAGYGYQDAPEIVASLEGSQTNVMGLPMTQLRQELSQCSKLWRLGGDG